MNKMEFATLAMALKTYYPKEDLLPNEQAMNLWFNQLQDLDYQLAETALNKWVAVNRWSPTIADIRGEAANICAGELPGWADGWEKVLKAIAKFGWRRQSEALDTMDDITRQCVERLGFVNICLSENITADRANFRTIYEAYAERSKRELQIPASTKARISQYKNAMIEAKGGGDG